jgi:hypothetical protein
MASYNKFNNFVQNLGTKQINLSTDQLKVALTAAANAPVATNSNLADLTEISYTNLSSRNVSTTSFTNTSGTSKLVCADLTLTASGGSVGPFRYVVLYDDTSTNKNLIAWYDIGSDTTIPDGGQLVIDFDQTSGVFIIS